MYGFIYNTLRSLIVESHGEEVWKELCTSVGAEEIVDGILDHHHYDESMVHKLVAAASEKLGISREAVLKSFGHFFFKTCKTSGHSSMLHTLGHDLHGFLMNLDSLHDHLALSYTQMQAPSFRCEKTDKGLMLHYHSQRYGLDSIVTGIVMEVAKDVYNLDVEMRRIKYQKTETSLPHHYVFTIEATDSTDDSLERLTGEINTHHTGQQSAALTYLQGDVEMNFEPASKAVTSGQCPVMAPAAGQGMHMESLSSNRSHSTGQTISEDQQQLLWEDNLEQTPACTQTESDEDARPDCKSPVPDTEETNELKMLLRNKLLQSKIVGHAPLLPTLPGASRIASRRGSTLPAELSNWPINPQLFQTCFPFHIIFDFDLTIRSMGISLSRILPKAVHMEAKLTDYFDLSRPAVPLTYQNIRESIHSLCILRIKNDKIPSGSSKLEDESGEVREALQFRGQMILTSTKDTTCPVLFLASPRISTIEELEHQGLYLNDIPVHDATRDKLFLNRSFRVKMDVASELEKTKKELQDQKSALEKEKKRTNDLLHAMLPSSVADDLIAGNEVSAMDYSEVSILFSNIEGFTTICDRCQPRQVVDMLNSLYKGFDTLLEKTNLYKVETIGDAYMVAAGLPDTSKEHAQAMTDQAFLMREEASKVIEPVNNQPIQTRIGIHSGPVVAGIVGKMMPRYCLFGDTVNTASRMESYGRPGYVHISEETFVELKESSYIFHGQKINVKGLGERQTYFVEPPTSEGELRLDIVRNESREVGALPVVHIDGETGPSTSTLRSPSFVVYNKCTMVKTPSVQFLPNLPANPTFESNNKHSLHPEHTSGGGLEMHRLVIPGTSTMALPRTSFAESPESQLEKNNRIAPHMHTSRNELGPPALVIQEVPESNESGQVSRKSNPSGTTIDAFISKTENDASSSVDPNAAAYVGSEHENCSNHSESSVDSRNRKSKRQANKTILCVIS